MSISAGFDFRSTLVYVNDTGSNSYVGVTPARWSYPFAYANGLTAGWTANPGDAFRDRDNTSDARLAGFNQIGNAAGTPFTFKIDGFLNGHTYDITIALGGSNQPYQYLQAKDGSTVLFTIDKSSGNASGQYYDANGNLFTTPVNWLAGNTPFRVTMTSASLSLNVGTPTVQSGNSTISYIFVQEIVSAGAPPSTIYKDFGNNNILIIPSLIGSSFSIK